MHKSQKNLKLFLPVVSVILRKEVFFIAYTVTNADCHVRYSLERKIKINIHCILIYLKLFLNYIFALINHICCSSIYIYIFIYATTDS